MKGLLKILVVLILCSIHVTELYAQEQSMSVSDFNLEFTDLDAMVNFPIKDQNGYNCAIIKVENVNKGFYFEIGQLGVTKVDENHVAETWVYLPYGAMRISIQHQQLGRIVYKFPIPIERGRVYRLVLDSKELLAMDAPKENIVLSDTVDSPLLPYINPDDIVVDTLIEEDSLPAIEPRVDSLAVTQIPKIERGGEFLLAAQLGYDLNDISFGAMAGWIKGRNGVYAKLLSNFGDTSASYSTTGSSGDVDGGTITPNYKPDGASAANLSVTAGYIRGITKSLYLYAGVGYGSHTLLWETDSNVQVKLVDYSYTGVAVDAGAMLRLGSVTLSAGVNTINFKQCDMTLGVGFIF